MKLSDFIEATLVEIAVGVKSANLKIHDEHGGQFSNSPFQLHHNKGDSKQQPGVSFDVAVSINASAKDKVGAGVMVASIFGVGSSAEETTADSYAHRIKFSVGMNKSWG